MRQRLGVDIGGTGIKGGVVDLDHGADVAGRIKLATPKPATPDAIAKVLVSLVGRFDVEGPLGITFPAVVRRGIVKSAANVDPSWIGVDGERLFAAATGRQVHLLNDADAAGIAEMEFGVGRDRTGTVIMVTFGTGIGTAIFVEGRLVPNTELGHLELHGEDAEHLAAAVVKTREGWGWKHWARMVDDYLLMLERLFSPDLFIVGGGVSKQSEKFLPRLTISTEIVPARLENSAGIAGAAIAAAARFG